MLHLEHNLMYKKYLVIIKH